MKTWLTVKEAAVVVGRHQSRIYRWIDSGQLASRVNGEGITEVLANAVLRIEPTVKRGRPRGSPTRKVG